jgi:hypothetical protein
MSERKDWEVILKDRTDDIEASKKVKKVKKERVIKT